MRAENRGVGGARGLLRRRAQTLIGALTAAVLVGILAMYFAAPSEASLQVAVVAAGACLFIASTSLVAVTVLEHGSPADFAHQIHNQAEVATAQDSFWSALAKILRLINRD